MEVITCLFGSKFKKLMKAPQEHSTLFTNNPSLKEEASLKGWRYEYVDSPLTNNYSQSSLQTKYIKFLQFNLKHKSYLYHDHKIKVTPALIRKVEKMATKDILVSFTPDPHRTILMEMKAGKGHRRYARSLPQTKKFLKRHSKKGFSLKAPAMRTGFIFYRNITPRVIELTKKVFKACMDTDNPHCQIFWGLYAPQYADIIQCVPLPKINYERDRKL